MDTSLTALNDGAQPVSATRRIERQTHFVAGLMLVTALALGTFVAPLWYALALLPTFGLFLDALTGFCPMSAILQKFPWNRSRAV